MAVDKPYIDPYLFQQHIEAFKNFVEEQSSLPFISFASNPYTDEKESYKYEIYRAGRDALAFQSWKQSDIGTGVIVDAVIGAIELPKNNLVSWQGRYGKEARPQHPLYEAKSQQNKLANIEACLFKLYHKEQDEKSFADLIEIFGKTYPLLAYLYFLKDRSKYLPIAPTFFDHAFEYLGADFKTSRRCSWENYTIYTGLIRELKGMLTESLTSEVTLLDAHSFAWMLSAQMRKKKKLPNVQEYLSLSSTEREAIVKARIGQGRFRQSLIGYWSACAVTGCKEIALLRASHIKPWAKSTLMERINLYNGLLLSPTLDACFDSGYISFDDDGNILISKRFKGGDVIALGIRNNMCLKKVDSEHKKYLKFHRNHIFK